MLADLSCRIEPFHGSDNAIALIAELIKYDHPYAIVLDGDYSVLSPRRSLHKRLVLLRRYSFENYLWESEPLNCACHRHARSGERTDVTSSELKRVSDHIGRHLRKLVELDVAATRSKTPPKVLSNRVEQLLTQPATPEIDKAKVLIITKRVTPLIDKMVLGRAKSDVRSFLRRGALIDLLRGHLLFGILRLVFTEISTSIRGVKSVVNDDALTQLLSDAVWRKSPTKEHSRLRTSLRKAVRSALPSFPPAPR
jgi:hypothetical protein